MRTRRILLVGFEGEVSWPQPVPDRCSARNQLNKLLGQGGMGEVYEARDTSKDRTVALKILPEELSRDKQFRTRFQRESRAAAMLEEPHVIPIHDWGVAIAVPIRDQPRAAIRS